MRAMVQLPGYLERVVAGGRDLALVLLPLLNDMRAVRGSALLSEGTLLLLNLKSDRQAPPACAGRRRRGYYRSAVGAPAARALQVGLIGWIRGERVDQNLEILANVADAARAGGDASQPVFQLWWVIGAVIEALREHGLDGGVSVKRLLAWVTGRSAASTKRARPAYCAGAAGGAAQQSALLRRAIHQPGSARGRRARLLPLGRAVAGGREHRAGARESLRPVRQAHADRGRCDPRGSGQGQGRTGYLRAPRRGIPEELAPQVDLLRKIGDTLGVLGLGEQRARVQAEIGRLERLVASRERPADSRAGGHRSNAHPGRGQPRR